MRRPNARRAKNKMLFRCILLVGVFIFCGCANVTPPPAPTQVPPVFEFSLAKPADRITYSAQGTSVQFDVYSASGIGDAHITQTAGAAPEQMTLHLHLRALEHFKFSFGDQTVEIEIPTTGAHSLRESVPPDSPLYMPVKIFSRDNAYPIQEGYIQIELPRAYFEAGAREFSIEWIDFYR